ncbi:glycosyltransferase [Varunaivibrio sulfuroxidans]|uniref:glycosyltransferase n=1 Tax=Varunaivibrio sulfuroxidans TaxID=1773489 RepID=UPI0014046B36|nr:glycosyltransferase family 2 protein [Varunaivibrio sulfuroxidans]WES29722.1 glycosyltransferase family 2 protein [Varunaivibrio sulfuroxidans]
MAERVKDPNGPHCRSTHDRRAPSTSWRKTTVVVVTHNSGAVIAACLEAIGHAPHIVVIDNASRDDTPDVVARVAPHATLVRNVRGVGYGNAASMGLARVKTPFALLLNPDSILIGDALERLVEDAENDPRAAVIAPALVAPDGSIDKSFDAAVHRREKMPRGRADEPVPEGPFCTWVVSGAVNLVRMTAMREIGFFDPAIFLYYEDDDMCMRLRARDHTVIFDPTARAEHIGGGSIGGGWWPHVEKFYHISWSRFYFEAKYRGKARAAALALRAMARHGPKALGYALILNRAKALRDGARLAGAAAYLLGLASSRHGARLRAADKARMGAPREDGQ